MDKKIVKRDVAYIDKRRADNILLRNFDDDSWTIPKYRFDEAVLRKKDTFMVMLEFIEVLDKRYGKRLKIERVIPYDEKYDPRVQIVNKLIREFDVEIPFLSWATMSTDELNRIYRKCKAKNKK